MTLLINLSPFLLLAVFAWLFVLRGKGKFKRESLLTVGARPLENLLPWEAYETDEDGYWRRLGLLAGATFGVLFALVELVFPTPNTRYSPPVDAMLSLLIGGPVFGFCTSAWLRRYARRIRAGLYSGEPWIISAPPADRLFYYQLVCIWLRGHAWVGGVLYLGRNGALFVPHTKNRKAAHPLEIAPIDDVSVRLTDPLPRNAIQRFLIPRPQKQIEVSWSGDSARFITPKATEVFASIGRCLEAMKRIPR